jgi:hypothetical protein
MSYPPQDSPYYLTPEQRADGLIKKGLYDWNKLQVKGDWFPVPIPGYNDMEKGAQMKKKALFNNLIANQKKNHGLVCALGTSFHPDWQGLFVELLEDRPEGFVKVKGVNHE